MAYTWQNKSSFLFGSTDMYQRFGIQIADDGFAQDLLKPQLRERKVVVPLRHGAYDYGARYYDERPIPITCVTVSSRTRDDAREMAYILSKKSEIRFWNEPDKYYIGRAYVPPDLEILRNVGNRFTINFIMNPFAYGQTITRSFTNLQYVPNYIGTAETPTYIVIENIGSGNAVNIVVRQTDRQE